MEKNKNIALNIFSIISLFFILIGLYALSSNITMKKTIGEITYCQKVYTNDSSYWDTNAKFFVDGKEYSGHINVTSHKSIGEKIMILYNPKNPNKFISQSSTYSGFTMIVFGIVFFIPNLQNMKKTKSDFENNL